MLIERRAGGWRVSCWRKAPGLCPRLSMELDFDSFVAQGDVGLLSALCCPLPSAVVEEHCQDGSKDYESASCGGVAVVSCHLLFVYICALELYFCLLVVYIAGFMGVNGQFHYPMDPQQPCWGHTFQLYCACKGSWHAYTMSPSGACHSLSPGVFYKRISSTLHCCTRV